MGSDIVGRRECQSRWWAGIASLALELCKPTLAEETALAERRARLVRSKGSQLLAFTNDLLTGAMSVSSRSAGYADAYSGSWAQLQRRSDGWRSPARKWSSRMGFRREQSRVYMRRGHRDRLVSTDELITRFALSLSTYLFTANPFAHPRDRPRRICGTAPQFLHHRVYSAPLTLTIDRRCTFNASLHTIFLTSGDMSVGVRRSGDDDSKPVTR
ncbi:hypothetical protein PM082_018273 [Marasmius tenuissimus]|nr:hypothetical protein PM082_018273 [Marasmius tenuissimus]